MAKKKKIVPSVVAIRLYHYGFSIEWLCNATVRQMYAVAKEKGLL